MRYGLTVKKIITLIMILVAAAGISAIVHKAAGEASNNALSPETANAEANADNTAVRDVISCKYYNEKDFRASAEKADARFSIQTDKDISEAGSASSVSANDRIIGGIVPHHLLASDMIAEFFKKLSESKPDTVVILAPNHNRSGGSAVSTGLWSWQTAFGKIAADTDLANYLVKNIGAGTNIDLLEEDHSVSALIPYIKYYMPDTKVVPVLLYGNYGMDKSIKLGRCLYEQLNGKKSLVLASVDFSHYLPPEEAESMDNITYEAIKKMDFDSISLMGNDNLDSPPALITFLSCMKNSGAKTPELVNHSNSSKISGKWSSSTTSYFTIIYNTSGRKP